MLPMLRKYFLESMQRTVCLSENHLVYHSNDNHISILHDDPNVTLSDFSFFFKFQQAPTWTSLSSSPKIHSVCRTDPPFSHEERSCVYHLTLFHSFSRPNFQVSSHKLFVRPSITEALDLLQIQSYAMLSSAMSIPYRAQAQTNHQSPTQ